MYKEMLLLYLL